MDKKIESIENDIRRYEQLYKEWCLNMDRKMKANTLNVNTLNTLVMNHRCLDKKNILVIRKHIDNSFNEHINNIDHIINKHADKIKYLYEKLDQHGSIIKILYKKLNENTYSNYYNYINIILIILLIIIISIFVIFSYIF